MSLSLNTRIDLGCSCDSVIFTELTGAYDALTNTGGYGSPNPATSDFSTVELIIKDELNSVTYDSIDLSSNFPSSSVLSQTINVSDLELSSVNAGLTKFADGKYSFTYKITTSGGTVYQHQVTKMSLCTIMCNIKNLAAKVLDCDCCTSNTSRDKLREIYSDYLALLYSGYCLTNSKVSSYLTLINNKLAKEACKGC